MNRHERNAWSKLDTILSRVEAAKTKAIADLRTAGFPVSSVEEAQVMRAQRLHWERARAELVAKEATLPRPINRATAQTGTPA